VVLRHVEYIVVLELVVDVVSVGKLGGVGGSSCTGTGELGLETDRVSLGFTTLMESENLVSDQVGTDRQRQQYRVCKEENWPRSQVSWDSEWSIMSRSIGNIVGNPIGTGPAFFRYLEPVKRSRRYSLTGIAAVCHVL
jgi:hypothetical protein